MSEDICYIEGCDNPAKCKGLCCSHYHKYKRYGDPLFVDPRLIHPDKCSIDGCERKYYSTGLCKIHYEKKMKKGDPLYCDPKWHGRTGTPEHSSWRHMLTRCYYKKGKSFHRYGGRGIIVCDRWKKSFKAFIEDMGEKPGEEYQIDRINNDGNYEPENCRWATQVVNAQNSSNTKLVAEDVIAIRKDLNNGMSPKQIAKKYGISRSGVYSIKNRVTWGNV